MALSANEAVGAFRPIINSFRSFAERVSRDPSLLTRGALQRQ